MVTSWHICTLKFKCTYSVYSSDIHIQSEKFLEKVIVRVQEGLVSAADR